ncbi:MAG: MATE family efflux transporter [Lachnospira sp.]
MSSKYKNQYEKMTMTPIPKLVLTLGIPTTISMLVTNIYNMADTMFVGKLNTSASGAVGIVFGYMAVIQAFGFMYGQGAGSIISRKLGAKNVEDATKTASTSFFFSMLTGIMVSLLSVAFLKPLLYLLGCTDTIYPYARLYVLFIIAAAPFMMSTFVMNNILRFEGRASLAMIGLLTGAILNMVGDPIFMFVFDMGIAGAGLSTALSQMVSFVILLFMFLSGKTQSKISIRRITRNIRDVWDIIGTGFPSFARQGLNSISTMILNNGAAVYGDAAVAAMSIVNRLSMFIFSTALGVGQGFQPVCGYNYGAKKYSRVKSAFKFTLVLSETMLGIMAVIVLMLSNQIIGVFRNDPEVIEIGRFALVCACMSQFFQPLNVLTNMSLQSTGQKLKATFMSLQRSGLYFIPVFLILSNLFGLKGIQIAQPVADLMAFFTALPFIIVFLKKLPEDGK